jgi:hypothetical protein
MLKRKLHAEKLHTMYFFLIMVEWINQRKWDWWDMQHALEHKEYVQNIDYKT